jgi:superfamily II DNA or RNA helicase
VQHDVSIRVEGLRPYQLEDVRQIIRWRKCLLANEPGLGKTATALAAVESAGCMPALVVTVTNG